MTKRALYLSFVLSAAAIIAADSCGPAKPSCGPKNCIGCCDTSGNCAIGVAPSLCGTAGAACQACLGGQICSLGVCRVPNGGGGGSGGGGGGVGGGGGGSSCAQSCSGCCAGGQCQAGNSSSACGAAGSACVACTGAQTCLSGTCFDNSCGGCVSNGTCLALNNENDSKCGNSGTTCTDCTQTATTCDVTQGKCTGGVCGGCRDFNGVCHPGTDRSACGLNGVNCAMCSGTQQCNSSGLCQSGSGGGVGGGGGGVGGGVGGGGGGVGGGGGGSVLPGDSCANAQVISASTTSITGSTVGYNDDSSGTCGGSGPDRVYSVDVPIDLANVTLTVTPGAGSYSPALYVQEGSCGIIDAEIGCGAAASTNLPASVSTTTLPAGQYYIWVDSVDGTSGSYTLTVSQGTGGGGGGGSFGGGVGGGGGGVGGGAGGGGVPVMQGDNCSNPLPITFINGSYSTSGDTTQYNGDYNDPSTACVTAGQDIVYTFSTSGGSFSASAQAPTGSNLYPALYLRSSCTGTASLGCNGGTASSAQLGPLSIGAGTYYLILDGDQLMYPGAFTLTVSLQ